MLLVATNAIFAMDSVIAASEALCHVMDLMSVCINILQCQPVTVTWGGQVEEHMIDGKMKQLLVHRKGSTRAFPPHHPLIPVDYQLTGQPVLIGGTMGTNSYVLTGAPPIPALATLKLPTFKQCYTCNMLTSCAFWLLSR